VRNVILVTGSRALDPRCRRTPGTEASLRWAREILLAEIIDMKLGDVVVTGDAMGPDEIALSLCRQLNRMARVFRKEGEVVNTSLRRTSTWRDEVGVPVHPESWRDRALARDSAMVRRVASMRGLLNLHAIALIAPWADTHGTEYTARHAEKAGITVARHLCPPELRR
jgi:hypothetical protein